MEDLEEEKDESSPKPKRSNKDNALLDSSDSNGSTPTSDVAARALVEKEVIRYRAEDPIEKSADPLQWWREVFLPWPGFQRYCFVFLRLPSHLNDYLVLLISALKPSNVDYLLFLNKNMNSCSV